MSRCLVTCLLTVVTAGCWDTAEPLRGPVVIEKSTVLFGRDPIKSKETMMTDAELLYRKGTALLKSHPEKAIEYFTQSLELAPDAPPVLYNRAVAYASLGRDMEAVADVKQLEALDPVIGRQLRFHFKASAVPYADVAFSEWKAGNFAQALKKCESALTYDPECGDAWVVKGLVLKALGNTTQALECYNKATEVEPDNCYAYINRAELHHEQKRLEQALSDYAKAIDMLQETLAETLRRETLRSEIEEETLREKREKRDSHQIWRPGGPG